MINKKVIAIVAFTLLAIFAVFFLRKSHHYRVDVISSEKGWGYNILIKDKIIIHQPYMPAVSGHVVFSDKSSARRAGMLVVKKLENKQLPGITPAELDSLLKTN